MIRVIPDDEPPEAGEELRWENYKLHRQIARMQVELWLKEEELRRIQELHKHLIELVENYTQGLD
jgi:hypothetical protein